MDDEELYCAVWGWNGEVKVFLIKDVGDKLLAQNDVRKFVGEGGEIIVFEVDWGVVKANYGGASKRYHHIAELT